MSSDNWAVNAALIATSALALAANSLLILVFFRRRGLRTVSNRFVINLLITNLLSSLVLIPLLLADQEMKEDIPDVQGLILKDLNSSSHLSLENIQLQFDRTNTSEMSTVFDEEEEDFELEILNFRDAALEEESKVKIRHFRTLNQENESKDSEFDKAEFFCYISEGSTSLVCTASILSILLIAIDQYFAVTHPLRYHTFIDKFKSLKLLISTWIISTIFGILGSFVRTDYNLWNFCTKKAIAQKTTDLQIIFNIVYSITYLSLVILVPFLVICVIYGCIYCAAHKNSERMRKSNSGSSSTNLDLYVQIPLDDSRFKVKVNSSDNLKVENELPTLPKVKSAPNFANLEKTRLNSLPNIGVSIPNSPIRVSHENSLRSNSSFINNLKTKFSNASLFKYREETRAAKISILVIFMVLVCYVPYGIALILNTKLLNSSPPHNFNSLSLSLLVLANLLSPFLFAYRNRRIQRELRKLFGLIPSKVPKEVKPRKNSMYQHKELQDFCTNEPILPHVIPEVVITPKVENEKKSILKRVCSKGKTWSVAKKCNFIPVESCLSVECRCSFSSASTQISSEEYSAVDVCS